MEEKLSERDGSSRGPSRWRFARSLLMARLLGRRRPLLVNIEPTHRCNLACSFCDKASPHAPQMETPRALRLIDELAAAGTCSICFDGGEPLVHPDIGKLIARARARGLRVAMSTNGILIPKRIDELAGVSVLKVSLDGDQEQHDCGRGVGAYQRALAGVQAARQRGIDVALRMTLASHNVDGWPAMLRMAQALGCKALFQPAIGSVMDQAIPAGVHSAEVTRYRAAIDGIARAQRAGAPVANERVCLQHLRAWPEPRRVRFCAGGRIEAAIGPDGKMFPCGRYGRHRNAPNVFTAGAKAAFAALVPPTDCANCWCTLTLATCYLWRLDPRLVQGRIPLPLRS